MKTFAAVMNIPSPYRLHLLGEMGRQLNERGYEFHCHFMSRGHADRPRSWQNPRIDFPHTYWRDYGIGEFHFNPGLIAHLTLHRPSAIYVGSPYDIPTSVFLSLFCWPSIKICGLEGNTKTPGRMTGWMGWFKRMVLSKYQYVSVPGRDGAGYMEMHQALSQVAMPQSVCLPNIIDETLFRECFATREERDAFRVVHFGSSWKDRVCLIPARFDPVKGLKEFFSVVPVKALSGWRLVVLGHGPDEQQTLSIVQDRGLFKYVQIIHSVPYNEMPRYYAAADLMLLPSLQDMNPLCVVEALHSSLPIALSDQAGNVEEAVAVGRNGWVLPVKDKRAYAEVLSEVFASSLEELMAKGVCSKKENACFWDTRKSVGEFLDKILI